MAIQPDFVIADDTDGVSTTVIPIAVSAHDGVPQRVIFGSGVDFAPLSIDASTSTVAVTGTLSVDGVALTAAALTVLDDASVSAMVNTLGGATATGTGGLVRATSPTLVTPLLGTPTSGDLSNCTGLPGGTGISGARIGGFIETFVAANLVDGDGATGTFTMAGAIPAGALFLRTSIVVAAGFAGDTSATVTVGDGSVVDRYMTGTPDCFSDAATGLECGLPSGALAQLTVVNPVITITSNADITSVITEAAGSITVGVFYIVPV